MSTMNASVTRGHAKKTTSVLSRFSSRVFQGFNAVAGIKIDDLCVELAPRFMVLPLSPDKVKFEAAVKKLTISHHGHILVWNFVDQLFKFSDKSAFDPKSFDEQVLDVSNFPDYVPRMTFTFELCNEIRYWLKQDKMNVAILMYEYIPGSPVYDELSLALSKEARVA